METQNDSTRAFLAQKEAIIDRLREVALREFEKGAESVGPIVHELTLVETIASENGHLLLKNCVNDISNMLQNWLNDPHLNGPWTALLQPWSDVVCELSNYLLFLGEDDENDLRDRVNYRLVQLVKARAALVLESAPVMHPKAREIEAPLESLLASHYLICLLGSQQYALPIPQVREILEERPEKALPSPREGIRGLVNLRGMLCPVLDVSHVLHAQEATIPDQDRKKRCLVVCEVDRRTFCFNVDDVTQVAALDEFEDPITPLHPENSIQNAISHVSHFQNKSVLFVKMREVIPA